MLIKSFLYLHGRDGGQAGIEAGVDDLTREMCTRLTFVILGRRVTTDPCLVGHGTVVAGVALHRPYRWSALD